MIYTVSGVFRCGPASVKAVKQGEVYLPYDTSFVFAEVNGDRVFWEVEEGGPMKPIRVDKKCIGKLISTKAVGSDDREDITHEYKHPEGILALSTRDLVYCNCLCSYCRRPGPMEARSAINYLVSVKVVP